MFSVGIDFVVVFLNIHLCFASSAASVPTPFTLDPLFTFFAKDGKQNAAMCT